MLKIMKKERFKKNDDETALLAWSTCSSAGVSPEKEINIKTFFLGYIIFGMYIFYHNVNLSSYGAFSFDIDEKLKTFLVYSISL